MKRVLIFFADGLEECEGLITVDVLRRAGIDVTIASVNSDLQVESSHGICMFTDASVEDVCPDEYDAVVLPGGIPGTPNLEKCALVRETCLRFAEEGKLMAAICAAPGVLARLGLLRGKKATIYPGMEDELEGAEHVSGEVAVDGTVITGRSMGAAIPFALTLVSRLLGEDAAKAVSAGIAYDHY